jgi:hypothetical protein
VNAGRCADLVNGTVLMARGMGFLPDDSEVRQGELARLALANGRKVLSADILQILGGKFGNPMLGIFGGHLLLMDASPAIRAAGGAVVTPEKKPDLGLLAQVVLNLRGLVGVSHPDVEALALACGGTAHRFSTPPMIRRSWALVVDRTVSESDLVPIGSLAADAAAHVLSDEPWLVWTSGDAPGVRGSIERNIASALRSHVRGSLPVPGVARTTSPFEAIRKMRAASSSAAGKGPAAGAAPPAPVPPATRADTPPPPVPTATPAGTPAPLPASPLLVTDESKIGFLVRTFGIPRSNVETMLLSMTPEEDADDNAQ